MNVQDFIKKIQGNLTKISLSAVGCYSFKRPVKIAAVQSYTVSKNLNFKNTSPFKYHYKL